MKPTIKVAGINEIKRNVRRMAEALDRNTVEATLMRNVRPVVDRAAEYAPKVSGKLADSMTASPNSSEDVGPLRRAETIVFVGPSEDVEYALPVETGTPPGITGPGQKFENTAPNPYLRPAFDEEAPRALRGTAEDLAKIALSAGKG